MQENCEDYYDLALNSDGTGCCMVCEDAEPDCLCYECKCKQCYHYSEGEHKGYCDIASTRKDRIKNKECVTCGTKRDVIKVSRNNPYTRKYEENVLMVCPRCQKILWRKWDWNREGYGRTTGL